jgi:lactate permease
VRQTWRADILTGVFFAVGQFVSSNFISVELTDFVGSLVATAALVLFLRVWHPGQPLLEDPDSSEVRVARPARAGAEAHPRASRSRPTSAGATRRATRRASASRPSCVVAFALAKPFDPLNHFLIEISGVTG